jgi:hypothetical protein
MARHVTPSFQEAEDMRESETETETTPMTPSVQGAEDMRARETLSVRGAETKRARETLSVQGAETCAAAAERCIYIHMSRGENAGG